MKKVFLSLVLISLLGFSPVYCQFSFGVSPGIGFNSAYFGYKMNKLVPSIGFQYFNANMKFEETGREYDNTLHQIVDYTDNTVQSINLFVPSFGAKYFIAQQNKVQAYVSLNISKPILKGKLKENDVMNDDFKDEINGISLWGGELGFGMEYFFDENFSLGGEFGLRYLHLKYNNSNEITVHNQNTGQNENVEIKTEYKLSFKPTYTRISLNYYF